MARCCMPELDIVGSIHMDGLGRVGSSWITKFSILGGSGPVSKISNKYTIYTQETDYSSTIIHNDKKL